MTWTSYAGTSGGLSIGAAVGAPAIAGNGIAWSSGLGMLVVATPGASVLVSSDGGATWTAKAYGFGAQTYTGAAAFLSGGVTPTVVVFGGGHGIAYSTAPAVRTLLPQAASGCQCKGTSRGRLLKDNLAGRKRIVSTSRVKYTYCLLSYLL